MPGQHKVTPQLRELVDVDELPYIVLRTFGEDLLVNEDPILTIREVVGPSRVAPSHSEWQLHDAAQSLCTERTDVIRNRDWACFRTYLSIARRCEGTHPHQRTALPDDPRVTEEPSTRQSGRPNAVASEPSRSGNARSLGDCQRHPRIAEIVEPERDARSLLRASVNSRVRNWSATLHSGRVREHERVGVVREVRMRCLFEFDDCSSLVGVIVLQDGQRVSWVSTVVADPQRRRRPVTDPTTGAPTAFDRAGCRSPLSR